VIDNDVSSAVSVNQFYFPADSPIGYFFRKDNCVCQPSGNEELAQAFESAYVLSLSTNSSWANTWGGSTENFFPTYCGTLPNNYPFPTSTGLLSTIISGGNVNIGIEKGIDYSPVFNTTIFPPTGFIIQFQNDAVKWIGGNYSKTITPTYQYIDPSSVLTSVMNGSVDTSFPWYSTGGVFSGQLRRYVLRVSCPVADSLIYCYALNTSGVTKFSDLDVTPPVMVGVSGLGSYSILRGLLVNAVVTNYVQLADLNAALLNGSVKAACDADVVDPRIVNFSIPVSSPVSYILKQSICTCTIPTGSGTSSTNTSGGSSKSSSAGSSTTSNAISLLFSFVSTILLLFI